MQLNGVVTRFAVALEAILNWPASDLARTFGRNGKICKLVARCLLLHRWYHEEAMYYRHFRLTGPPFEAVTGSETVYLSRAHRESLAALEWGLLYEPSGFTTLTGETGTGKTTLGVLHTGAQFRAVMRGLCDKSQALV